MSGRALVGNASDEGQVKDAERKERVRRRGEMADLRAVLATPEGRRTLYWLLDHCGTFRTIWHPSAAIHYRAGEQDVGHWLMEQMGEADPKALAAIVLLAYPKDAPEEEDLADG